MTTNICYIDIECYSGSTEVPDPSKAPDKVTCVGIASSSGGFVSFLLGDKYEQKILPDDEVHYTFSDEKKLLNAVCHLLSNEKVDPDILTAWNIDFDVPYLQSRCKKYDLDLNLRNINVFDLLSGYRNLFSRTSYKLKDVVLNEGITIERQPQLDYRKLFDEDKDELRRVNSNHTKWIRDLDEKCKICEYFWQVKQFVGLESLDNVLYSSVLIDTLLLREYHGKYVLPTKEVHEKVPYEGAIVLEPKKGIYHGLAVFDMSAYYPSVLIEENLSPEVYYGVSTEKGILPIVSETLMNLRNQLKDKHPLKYAAVKAIHNSLYGVLASTNFRIYIPAIAARITEVAREGLKFIIAKTEEKGYKVIFGDTDSIAVEISKEEAKELLVHLNAELKSFGEGYDLKFEKYFTTYCCLGQKKRYFGEVEGKDKIEIKGFEDIRTDSSKLTKKVQERIMRLVLDEDRQGSVDYLREIANNFSKYSYDEIAIPKGLSRELTDYKTEVDYVRGAKWMSSMYKYIKIGAGDKIYFLYAHKPYDVISVLDTDTFSLMGDLKINEKKMLERVVVKPVEDLIGILGIDWAEIEGQGRLL